MQGKGKKILFYLHIINQSSPELVHCIWSNLTATYVFWPKCLIWTAYINSADRSVKTLFFTLTPVWKRVLPSQKGNWRTGKNSKTLWERPFPGDTRWLREGTESLTPAEYPWDNDYNRTWLQCRGLIQDYTAGRVRNITNQNVTKTRWTWM